MKNKPNYKGTESRRTPLISESEVSYGLHMPSKKKKKKMRIGKAIHKE